MNKQTFIDEHNTNEDNRVMRPLPLWKPEHKTKFNTNMGNNSPFVVTQFLQRSDLGFCVISTRPPHFVARIRAFATNEKRERVAEKNEQDRIEWLNTRYQAAELAHQASQCGLTVKEWMDADKPSLGSNTPETLCKLPKIYDEEFDESRVIAKVPGLNVYLELFGCLDPIDPDEVEWKGYNGAYATLERMSVWAQNIWTRIDRRQRATSAEDEQPLPDWCEDYDETLRPFMPSKRGIGVYPDVDYSRRPDMLHSKAPRFDNAAVAMDKQFKEERARLAAMGIKE